MKFTTKMLTLVAGVALLGMTATASALESPKLMAAENSVCYNFTESLFNRKCVKFDRSDVKGFLARVNYPDSIVITRKKDWAKANADWNKSEACHRIGWMHDDRVTMAKFYKCELARRGVEVKAPKIISAF